MSRILLYAKRYLPAFQQLHDTKANVVVNVPMLQCHVIVTQLRETLRYIQNDAGFGIIDAIGGDLIAWIKANRALISVTEIGGVAMLELHGVPKEAPATTKPAPAGEGQVARLTDHGDNESVITALTVIEDLRNNGLNLRGAVFARKAYIGSELTEFFDSRGWGFYFDTKAGELIITF